MKVSIVLPLVKETTGALRYGLPEERRDHLVSDIYVRKDKMRAAGHTGPWPATITVTVEVASNA